MESKQLDLDHQVLVSDVKTDLIPLVNVEPNVNREHENPFNESKMRKYDIKLVIFFILVLCLTVVALALGLVSVLNKQSRELPVAPTTNHLKSYNESSLTTKLDKLKEQQEDLKKQVKALIKTFKKLDKLRNQYEDSKEQIVGNYSNSGNSCLDILQQTKEPSLSSGDYWIILDSKPLKVYCDMKTDGGGWTLITNLVLEQSKGMDWSLTSDYRQIEEYKKNKLALSTYGLHTLGTKLSFKQLRFFCHKKIPGRTFDIATTTNSSGNHVVQYFTAQTDTNPESCGSYYRLYDDNSTLAGECARWGRRLSKYYVGIWHNDVRPINDRLLNHAAYIGYKAHWHVEQSSGRWECDDFAGTTGYAVSSGDFWKIFVR